jgi:hypothetical protein
MNTARAVSWLTELLDDGRLSPCRALILSAEMVDEAIALAQHDFHALVVDKDEEALRKLKKRAQSEDAWVDTVHGDAFSIRPGFWGPVELVCDRTFIRKLEPIQRADWSHLVGRILPRDGCLAGSFHIGRRSGGPPFSITLAELELALSRLFVTERLERIGSSIPGADRVYTGIFRHK